MWFVSCHDNQIHIVCKNKLFSFIVSLFPFCGYNVIRQLVLPYSYTPSSINTIPSSSFHSSPCLIISSFVLFLMSTFLLNIFQAAVNTAYGFSPTISNFNIFQGMSQRTSSSIAHSHISLNFNWGNLFNELECIRSVLTQLVLRKSWWRKKDKKLLPSENYMLDLCGLWILAHLIKSRAQILC